MTDKVGINDRGFCIVAHASRSDDMTRTFVLLLVLNLSGPNVAKNIRVRRLCGVQAFFYVVIDTLMYFWSTYPVNIRHMRIERDSIYGVR